MKYAACAALILAAASLEASLGALPPAIPRPNLAVVLTTYFAMRMPETRGGVAAFALGYLRDLLSGGVLGAYAFLLLVFYVGARAMARRFFTRRWILVLFTVVAGAMGAGAGYYLLVRLLDVPVALPPDFGRRLLGQALATAVVALPVWTLLEAFERLLARRPAEGQGAS